MSHENTMETSAQEYMPVVNNKILHENDNVYLLRIWGSDCDLLDQKLFKGDDKTAKKACNVLQHINKNSRRATFEIFTKELEKTLHKITNQEERETHDIFT